MHIRVKVSTGSRKENLEEVEGTFKISVKEKAERNEANVRVRELLARHFGVPVKSVRLVSGAHSPSKIFEIL